MRLLTDVRTRFFALGLTAMLAACGRGADDIPNFSSAAEAAPQTVSYGPEADYPVVIGKPYTVEGQLFTPADRLNYDEVGYAGADPQGGTGITASHKTLPLPSYVEVTSLDTGKTALVRVERRGPMTTQRLVGLSAGALSQLGISDGSPIRIRRVNALETDRAKLRRGQAASERMETPASLVAILKRKLPESGSVSLAQANPPAASVAGAMPAMASSSRAVPESITPAAVAAAKPSTELPAANAASFADAFSRNRAAVTQYPLPPLSGARQAAAPVRMAPAASPRAVPRVARTAPPASSAVTSGDIDDGFVIQAAAFSSKANAERAASKIDGFIQQSGRYYRVRKGPFANRGQAEAALAKIRAAGYRDARVFSAG
ncbi:SPOR domain-containing protein [Pontixanthobacter rizhaonensis]|uniref:SPOR domain-containing protein n=1 Tax=Pontixanthobacter rizhaonensis TaxID=2730337 RepID=UPI001FE832E2|nr:SPOR domain-containing protein [Pontixanthobacter rizhaonensis]